MSLMDEFKKCSRSQRGMKIEESNSELNIQLIRGKVNKKITNVSICFSFRKIGKLTQPVDFRWKLCESAFADPRSMIEFRSPGEEKVEKYCHLIWFIVYLLLGIGSFCRKLYFVILPDAKTLTMDKPGNVKWKIQIHFRRFRPKRKYYCWWKIYLFPVALATTMEGWKTRTNVELTWAHLRGFPCSKAFVIEMFRPSFHKFNWNVSRSAWSKRGALDGVATSWYLHDKRTRFYIIRILRVIKQIRVAGALPIHSRLHHRQ